MERRAFGRTGLTVSLLGFGCGAVGGLMVRGDPADQERTIGRALDAGVNYFDTAVIYGAGASERNLGRVLKALKPRDAVIGTKVRLAPAEYGGIEAAVRASLEASLRRLGRDSVDMFHLHNFLAATSGGEMLGIDAALGEVLPVLEALRAEGKIRVAGMTAVGDTPALHRAVGTARFGSAQIAYNMLNPSAGAAIPAGYPAQDYAGLLDAASAAGTGVVGIRVLAGGALSGSMDRHAIASPPPAPIGSAASYEGDVARARRLQSLVTEGFAASLPEAAIRFAIGHPAMSTILVGMATQGEFDGALAAVRKGPLPAPALARLAALQQGLVGEPR